MNNDYRNTFGKRIKKCRNGKKMTQEVFAEHLGKRLGKEKLSIETIRKWEQGRGLPELDTLIQLCDILECDMDYLIGRLEEKTHEVHNISEKTGLSEEAIEKLMEEKKECCFDGEYYIVRNSLAQIANVLILGDNMEEFQQNIGMAIHFAKELQEERENTPEGIKEDFESKAMQKVVLDEAMTIFKANLNKYVNS